MYTEIWQKYLPVIRILVKRASQEEQSLKLNLTDFEKTGKGRKAAIRFTIEFKEGRMANSSNLPPMAKELGTVLLQDETIRGLFSLGEYHLHLSSKFLLNIKCFTPGPLPPAI